MTRFTYSLASDRKWPETWSERHAEFARRRSAFRGGGYTDEDFKRMYLFQGCNARGEVIIKTRRVSTMLSFVAKVDAACIGGKVSLNVSPTKFPKGEGEKPGAEEVEALKVGQDIMRRACVDDMLGLWCTTYTSEGDLFLEMGTDDDLKWTFYAATNGTASVFPDKFGRRTESACVEFMYTPAGETTPVKYKRTVTTGKDGKIVTEDGNKAADTKPNKLGVSTVVWVPFDPVPGSYGFSKCAFTDVEDVVAKSDSATTQMSAIGTRWADPTLVTKGFALQDDDSTTGAGSRSATMGKTLPIAKDEDVDYLVVDLTNVESIVKATSEDMDAARKGLPEYMFTDSSASSSGLAMSYQATALVAKLEPPQDRLHRAIARLVGMCRAAELNQPWSDEMDIYVVTGPPILPMDKAATVELLIKLREAGLILDEDATEQLQSLGYIDAEHDPAEYAEKCSAEADTKDGKVSGILEKMSGKKADAPEGVTPAAAVVATDTAVQDTALNGAQFTSMLDALERVAAGTLSKESAKIAIGLANPAADPQKIADMVNAQAVTPPASVAAISPALAA